jgi:hypothetical protein
MEVDTGASMSLMSEGTFRQLWPGRSLSATDVRLADCSDLARRKVVPATSCFSAIILCHRWWPWLLCLCTHSLYNFSLCWQGHCNLLYTQEVGRDWLSRIRLDWKQIYHVHSDSLQEVLDRYPGVFQEGLGKMKGFKAKIYVDPNTPP